MKYYCSLVLLSLISINTACAISPLEANEIRFMPDAIIRQLFEMLRRLIVNGDSIKGIPSMDPMILDRGEFYYSGQILRYNSEFNNGSISGAGAFRLEQCLFDKDHLSIIIDMNFPSLVIDAEHYELAGDIWEAMPLKGIGQFHLELRDIKLHGKLYLKQSEDGKSILLDRIENAKFSVDQVSSQINFDGIIDDIFNAIIGDVFSRYITGANGLIIRTYSDSFIQVLNSYLNQFESWRILAVIL